eukprot:gene42830-53458_t
MVDSENAPLRRAGFWRRVASVVIDGLIIHIPFQIAAAILFAYTSGYIQMTGGVVFHSCGAVHSVPANISPPAPKDSNYSTMCKFYFLGAQTAGTLLVGRIETQGTITTNNFQQYWVDRDGIPVSGHSLDPYALGTTLFYFIVLIWRFGATLGCGVMHIKVVDRSHPARIGVPLGKT